MTSAGAEIIPWGDQAVLVRLGTAIDPATDARVTALLAAVDRAAPAWLSDCIPGYASLLLVFDLLAVAADDVVVFLRAQLAVIDADAGSAVPGGGRRVNIPVFYDPAVGPDLASVVAHCGTTTNDVIRRHSSGDYRVYMLGFRPGFAFLGAVDPALAVPRLSTPRTDVAAGSVGIAEAQTGIYPTRGPGGWSIIGRTPLLMFDAVAAEPFRLRAGDRVRFVPIDEATYQSMLTTDAH